MLGVGLAVTLASGVVTWRFIAADPYEYDMKKIRSDAPAALEAQRWMDISNGAFGRGVVGRTYFAVDRRADVAPLVAALRDLRDRPRPHGAPPRRPQPPRRRGARGGGGRRRA